ncbi:hypothetical protein ACHHRT_01120 [Desulfurivibrio sp. D14AmB]|uniref:hypothetical protein n=1 Tax=Desulfurivibrio sp. D14AmB TaxID=3374370 RepID=UPI00376F2EB5
MAHDERRICKLRLRGSDPARLRQAQARLEEAFRIASLPGLPPNAQVLIRRLSLGAISLRQSPGQLSDRISELVRNLAGGALCVDGGGGESADLVWFSDPLQPYRVLLTGLLDGRPPRQWYWLTLFPWLRPGVADSSTSSTITRLLLESCRTPLRGLAPAWLVHHCLEPRRLDSLFALLSREMVGQVVIAQGFRPFASPKPSVAARGDQDSLQLAGPAPSIPAPSLGPSWRRALERAMRRWGERDPRSIWMAALALSKQLPACLEERNLLARINLAQWRVDWGELPGALPARGRSGKVAAGEMGAGGAPARRDSESSLSEAVGQMEGVAPGAGSTLAAAAGVAVPGPAHLTEAGGAERDHRRGGEEGPGGKGSVTGPRVEAGTHGEELEPFFSPQAGFGLLIALWERLGMAPLLAANPRLRELDFPRRLLLTVAMRCRLAEEDPTWELLTDLAPDASPVIEGFVAPDLWRSRLRTGDRPLPSSFQIRSGDPVTLADLLAAFQLISGCWLRRHCGLSLRSLVARPGRVTLTATHWDLFYQLDQVDLRLRRVALDSDPGWVSWLGKVVQFHYD